MPSINKATIKINIKQPFDSWIKIFNIFKKDTINKPNKHDLKHEPFSGVPAADYFKY